jgi:hypothetical protein
MYNRWGEHEGHTGGERNFDLYPPALDAGTLASRKSSSSTDSSSSHSLHSRSTTGSEGGAVSFDCSRFFVVLHSCNFRGVSTINNYCVILWALLPMTSLILNKMFLCGINTSAVARKFCVMIDAEEVYTIMVTLIVHFYRDNS